MSETEGERFWVEVDIEGRTWGFEADAEDRDRIHNKLEAMIKKFGGSGKLSANIDMNGSIGKVSWSFTLPDDEEYERFVEMIEKMEENNYEY